MIYHGWSSPTPGRCETSRPVAVIEMTSAELREALGQPEFTVDDQTAVLAQRFRLVAT